LGEAGAVLAAGARSEEEAEAAAAVAMVVEVGEERERGGVADKRVRRDRRRSRSGNARGL